MIDAVRLSRRRFLSALGVASGFTLERLLDAQSVRTPAGRLIRVMPLGRFDRRPAPPPHVLLGAGLDARQFADLAAVEPDHLITPTDHFFIRTAHPAAMPSADRWRLTLGGLVKAEHELTL